MKYQDCGAPAQAPDERPADRTEARLADANINPRTRLATDYLNHFNEAVTPQAVVDGLMQLSG